MTYLVLEKWHTIYIVVISTIGWCSPSLKELAYFCQCTFHGCIDKTTIQVYRPAVMGFTFTETLESPWLVCLPYYVYEAPLILPSHSSDLDLLPSPPPLPLPLLLFLLHQHPASSLYYIDKPPFHLTS